MVPVFMQLVGIRQILKWTELDIDLFYARGTFLVKVLVLMLHIKVHTIALVNAVLGKLSGVLQHLKKLKKHRVCFDALHARDGQII